MSTDDTPSWGQTIAGKCPACGSSSLFVAMGGHATCALIGCPNPTMLADILLGEIPFPNQAKTLGELVAWLDADPDNTVEWWYIVANGWLNYSTAIRETLANHPEWANTPQPGYRCATRTLSLTDLLTADDEPDDATILAAFYAERGAK